MPDQLQSTHHDLPEWTALQIVVLDASQRWTPAIHRETLDQTDRMGVSRLVHFETCDSARDVLLCCEMKNTVALIVFAAERERDCLSILGRMQRRRQSLPVLIICDGTHEDLVPVMYEAGAGAVLFDVRNDVPIGAWCARIVAAHG